MKQIKKEERSKKLIKELLNVWESSVRATHNFLYIRKVKQIVLKLN